MRLSFQRKISKKGYKPRYTHSNLTNLKCNRSKHITYLPHENVCQEVFGQFNALELVAFKHNVYKLCGREQRVNPLNGLLVGFFEVLIVICLAAKHQFSRHIE